MVGGIILTAAVVFGWLAAIASGPDFARMANPVFLVALVIAVGWTAGMLDHWRATVSDLQRLGKPREAPEPTEDELTKHRELAWSRLVSLTFLENTLIASAIVGFLLSLIHATAWFNEPPEIVGRLLAGPLLCLVYGFTTAKLIVAPLAARLADGYDREFRLMDTTRAARPDAAPWVIGVAALGLAVLLFHTWVTSPIVSP